MSEPLVEQVVGQGRIVLKQGDIVEQRVDAIVTAANSGLRGGGGVDFAVHHACGPQLLQSCRQIGGCPTGSAVATPAHDLQRRGVRSIIHAVGPIWNGGRDNEPELLRSAYATALRVAQGEGCNSIAFPSISSGIYGYPVEQAASIALEAAVDHLRQGGIPHLVLFVLFDETTHTAFQLALQQMVIGQK